jgi:hypothetical protein
MGSGVRGTPQLRADVATQEGYVSKFVCEDGAKTTLAKASRSRTDEVIESMESVVCVCASGDAPNVVEDEELLRRV